MSDIVQAEPFVADNINTLKVLFSNNIFYLGIKFTFLHSLFNL